MQLVLLKLEKHYCITDFRKNAITALLYCEACRKHHQVRVTCCGCMLCHVCGLVESMEVARFSAVLERWNPWRQIGSGSARDVESSMCLSLEK